jgi:hypothetical protein
MPVDLFRARLEEWSSLIAGTCRDNDRWNNPHADDVTAAAVDVSRILKGHLGISSVNASGMFMR